MVELDRMRMRAYYERMEREGGFVSFCRMWLPEDIAGARVLDVGCRRGKGVYQICARRGLERTVSRACACGRGGGACTRWAFRVEHDVSLWMA